MTDNDILKLLESRKAGHDEMAVELQAVINANDTDEKTRARTKYQLEWLECRIAEMGHIIRIITEEKQRLKELATLKINIETAES